MDQLLVALTLLAALGSGLIAGAFFAFSTFVMTALARRPAAEGIAAMQSINVVVINPLFLGVFLGTAGLGALAMIVALVQWDDPRAPYWLAGGALYVVGTFLVTIGFNVPRNNALAALDPADPASASYWSSYVSGWTAWNHVRTAAALGAATAFGLGLRY